MKKKKTSETEQQDKMKVKEKEKDEKEETLFIYDAKELLQYFPEWTELFIATSKKVEGFIRFVWFLY